ncbi:calcyphosin-2 [Molothrus ater]|uniref:calcyphosin-2 n=1 Tax=Molothrus ater TaxID=84834 RepID=UPI0023E7AFB2|nr:calcyphosin-2 [Molothrus ater]
MSLQTPYAQHQHVSRKLCQNKLERTRPENLPALRDRSKLKHGQYEEGMKEEYKQHPQRIAEKKKDHLRCPDTSIKGTQLEDGHNDFVTLDKKALLQQCYTNLPYNMQHNIRKSEAEDVTAERRKQAVVEQVMVDQLCRPEIQPYEQSEGFSLLFVVRAVISDPEQSTHSDACQEAPGLLGAGMAPMRFRKRTLHETKIRTKSGLTENMLSNKLRFDSRIISREFIIINVDKEREKLMILVTYVGANLTFISVDHNLPESVKQNPFFTLCVISIDEAAMDYLKASSLELKEECSRQVVDESEVFRKIQGIFRETLSKRGFGVITGLGKYFRQIDKNRNGLLSRTTLKEAPKVFHLEMPEGVSLAGTKHGTFNPYGLFLMIARVIRSTVENLLMPYLEK